MKAIALAVIAAACSAKPTTTSAPTTTDAIDATAAPIDAGAAAIDAAAPMTFAPTADRFGPIAATTPLTLDALRAVLPGLTVDEVVRDADWARYPAFAVRDADGPLFDVIPGQRDQRLIEIVAVDRLDDLAVREQWINGPRPCAPTQLRPAARACPSPLANLRWLESQLWLPSQSDAPRVTALWWPATGEPPERFTPLLAPGLAAARVVAAAASPNGLSTLVGRRGGVVIQSLGERDPGAELIVHACGRLRIGKGLAVVQSDLGRAVAHALAFFPLTGDPAEGFGITCTTDPTPRCDVRPTSEGNPAFSLRFADATPTAPLIAVIERDDWQSPDGHRAALDAKIDRAVARAARGCP